MALVFRALWSDDVEDPVSFGLAAFRAWVAGKHGLDVPNEGAAERPDGQADVLVERVTVAQQIAIRATLHEERVTERWTSTLTVLADGQGQPWFWVDLELVAQDAFDLPVIESPRLVRELLDHGTQPRRGPVALRTSSQIWRARDLPGLVDLIQDSSRDVPVVIFTPDPEGGLDMAQRRASSAALLLSGVASVGVLSPTSVRDFGDQVGEGLGVWGGACRAYLPGVGSGNAPHRHFFVTSGAMHGDERQGGRIVFRRLATSIAARRAPAAYDAVRAELARSVYRRSVDALESDYLKALEDQQNLRLRLEAEESLRVDAIAEVEEANDHVARLQRELDVYRRVVGRLAADTEVWTAATGEAEALPQTADSCDDAARKAQSHLANIVVPESALTKVSELDTQVESRAWGQAAWRGFRALDAYVPDARRFAGFWDWCNHSGSPYAWPATPKKLAMSESEGVMNSPSLREARTFAVSRDVDPSGRAFMDAHLKIAEGGGPMAPRIYFHNDTRGRTRKVHVGYFGPHKYVPNQSVD